MSYHTKHAYLFAVFSALQICDLKLTIAFLVILVSYFKYSLGGLCFSDVLKIDPLTPVMGDSVWKMDVSGNGSW